MAESRFRDLPADVLPLIGSHLSGKDRICFRSVCRTWRSAISSLPSPSFTSTSLESMIIPRFPLLMSYGVDSRFRKFYHPIYNTTYAMNTPTLVNARVLFSKDGWLIMFRYPGQIFFYNPVLNKRIHLPFLQDICTAANYNTISFSSVPTSPDCVVICVIQSSITQWKSISIRRGQTEWTTCRVKPTTTKFIGSNRNPVFHNGLFYYMDKYGLLGTYDPAKGSDGEAWTVLVNPKQPCKSVYYNYLVDCDGDLISVFMGRYLAWVKVFKLDFDKMMWKKLDNLGDNILFLSQTTSLATSTSDLEIKGMENTIFLPRFHGKNGGSIFYSLKSRKLHTLGSGYNSIDFYDTTLHLYCTWLDSVSSDTLSDDKYIW